MKPRVAVTHDAAYDVAAYLRAVALGGGDPVAFTPDDPPSIRDFDALVLSGGVDVDPSLYGEEPHPQTEQPVTSRDLLELALLRQALDRRIPVLAICRGMQLLNVAHGGALHQHLPDVLADGAAHESRSEEKWIPVHKVRLAGASALRRIFDSPEVLVNSRHHQGVRKVGDGLTPVAVAEDGLVEAVELTGAFAIGVQWHPEDQAPYDPAQRRLFEKFIECARVRAY